MLDCMLQPKRDMTGTTIFQILENWNELGNSTRDIKSYKEFKKCNRLNENMKFVSKRTANLIVVD